MSSSIFTAKLESAAARVDKRLQQVLEQIGGGPAPPSRLAAAMRHGSLGGGKRLRPFLLLESAALFGIAADDALDAAIALECVHCYSLIHDDLPAMDDDALRRGRATVHVAFDQATAILAGDSLLTLAFEILARPDTHSDPAVRADLALALAVASGWQGMAGGQMLDLDAEGRTPQAEEVTRIHALKTAALMACACEAGAILAQADPDARSSLRRFGRGLGLAFQLTDDILDVVGDVREIGKATGKDRDAGKATLVAILGLEQARARLDQIEAEAIQALAPFGDRAATLAETARYVTRRTR